MGCPLRLKNARAATGLVAFEMTREQRLLLFIGALGRVDCIGHFAPITNVLITIFALVFEDIWTILILDSLTDTNANADEMECHKPLYGELKSSQPSTQQNQQVRRRERLQRSWLD